MLIRSIRGQVLRRYTERLATEAHDKHPKPLARHRSAAEVKQSPWKCIESSNRSAEQCSGTGDVWPILRMPRSAVLIVPMPCGSEHDSNCLGPISTGPAEQALLLEIQAYRDEQPLFYRDGDAAIIAQHVHRWHPRHPHPPTHLLSSRTP